MISVSSVVQFFLVTADTDSWNPASNSSSINDQIRPAIRIELGRAGGLRRTVPREIGCNPVMAFPKRALTW